MQGMKISTNMRLFRFLCLITGILCLSVAGIMTVVYSFTIGNMIAFIAGIVFIGLYLIYPRLTNRNRKIINGLLIAWGIYMISMFIFIGKQGTKNTTTFTEDCVLVLGGGLKKEKVVPTLRFRLDKCLDYLQHNPKAPVIVSGGMGRGETICESEAMKRYLVSKGVNANQIIEENQSKNTRQNMQFSKVIMDSIFPSGSYSVVCITSNYHAYRANKLAGKVNLSVSHYNAKTYWYLYPAAYCRETLSIIKMWLGL